MPKIKIQSIKNCQNSNFWICWICLIWFDVKFEWQKNSKISTLWLRNLNSDTKIWSFSSFRLFNTMVHGRQHWLKVSRFYLDVDNLTAKLFYHTVWKTVFHNGPTQIALPSKVFPKGWICTLTYFLVHFTGY